jgi:acetamidase/formamidase
MTGPIYVGGAKPGDLLEVRYLQMIPHFNYGSLHHSLQDSPQHLSP